MKRIGLFLTLTLLASLSLMANDPVNPITGDTPFRGSTKLTIENELSMLNALIGVTEHNLKSQKQLRSQIQEYKDLQHRYMANTDNTELLFRVAKSANTVYTHVEESHLEYAFTPEFLKELKLFAQVSKKRGIPRPR